MLIGEKVATEFETLPIISAGGNESKVTIIRGSSSHNVVGFSLVYDGVGTGNDNQFKIEMDGSKDAFAIKQNGEIYFKYGNQPLHDGNYVGKLGALPFGQIGTYTYAMYGDGQQYQVGKVTGAYNLRYDANPYGDWAQWRSIGVVGTWRCVSKNARQGSEYLWLRIA